MTTTISIENNAKHFDDQHGLIFKVLLYTAITTTVFLFSYLKPPGFYKDFMSKIFNITFKWRGAYWKVYNIIGFILALLGLVLGFLKMQVDQFTESQPMMETHEKRIFRLKYKWLIEAEIWLTTLIIIELVYIFS